MVVETFFKAKWADKRSSYSVFLGVFFTLISFITSLLLFRTTPHFIGISTILFSVVLSVPSINRLFDLEEKIEVKQNLSFFKKHEHIIDFFLYYFIGVFITFFVISLIQTDYVFSEHQLYNIESDNIASSYSQQFGSNVPAPPPPPGSKNMILSLFKNNFYILVVSFALSLFYGAGALFLITLNASIFASALASVVKNNLPSHGFLSVYSFTLCNLGIMFFHMIPEVAGYLLAAIAGGVLSQAFIREKFGSKNFLVVLLDSLILFFISVIIIFLAAVIENGVSKKLLRSDVCIDNQIVIIIVFAFIILSIIFFEFLRKHWLKRMIDKTKIRYNINNRT